jgi:hypothetical protein
VFYRYLRALCFLVPNSNDSKFQIRLSIQSSSAKRIEALITDLSSTSAVTRESAIARLTLIGPRAVARLITLIQSGPPAPTRAAALRALEGIEDPRAVDPAILAIEDADPEVALAAIGVAGVHLQRRNSAKALTALDRLTATSLDRTRPDAIRSAALRALSGLDRRTIAPLLRSLGADPVVAQTHARTRRERGGRAAADPREILRSAAEQGLPDDAEELHQAVVTSGDSVALSTLLRIVERVRERETETAPAGPRASWATVRAAAHVALANRASRLALYDLRESLETANGRLPIEFLTVLMLIGDASCLHGMAIAHARSRDSWFRERLADVFRTVVKREHLTRRHAVLKKIHQRWPGTFKQLVGS